MWYRRAFLLCDGVIVIVLVVSLGPVVQVACTRSREISNRSVCSSSQTGIYKAFYVYSVTNNDVFPIAGTGDPDGAATGFREGDRAIGAGAELDNNATASLFLIVRDGSSSTGSFVCPSSGDDKDPLSISLSDSTPASLEDCSDFLERRNLSYSPINMFHVNISANWSSAAPGDYVLMGDNNATDLADTRRHTLTKGASQIDVEMYENSPNHDWEGQNFMFGDGHVAFVNDPFVGRFSDNAYAMIDAGMPATPRLTNFAGDAGASDEIAVVDASLLPVSGNGGVSLSGLALEFDGGAYPALYRAEQRRKTQFVMTGLVIAGVIGLVAWLAVSLRNARRHATPPPTDE